MRSRFAAFAIGLGAYLVDTLAATHPERFRPREVLVRELSAAHLTQRFVSLRIVDSNADDDPARGQVLFHAGIFERGRDQSFVELSDFVREPSGWRYADGVLVPATTFNAQELASLTRATFLVRVKEAGA